MSDLMSDLREENTRLPSHAAILRQQMTKSPHEQPAQLGWASDIALGDRSGPPDSEPPRDDRRVIFDQEESLIYI